MMSEHEPIPFKPKLVDRTIAPYAPLIGHIERLLEQAKSGELQALAYAMVLTDGVQPDANINWGTCAAPKTQFGVSTAIVRMQRGWENSCE